MIENTHNFIANDIIAHNTYINGGLNATGGLNVSGGAYFGGSVGIGTTSPGMKLEVKGGDVYVTDSTNVGLVHLTATAGNASVISDYKSGSDIPLYLGTYTNQQALTIQATTGNVGIGTTSPVNPLHVVTTSNQQGIFVSGNVDNVYLTLNNTAAGGGTWVIDSTGGTSGLGQGKLIFKNGTGQEAIIPLTLLGNGNVGIGTTSPSRELHVIGDANITGDLRYGTAGANSPIFFKSDGPEPICMKAENNVYVGCIPKVKNNKYEWACGETVECNRKMVLVQERDKLKEKIKGQELEEKLDKLNQRIKEKIELREMLDEVRLFEQEEGIGGELISIPEQLNATIEINQTAVNATIPIIPAPIVNTSNQTTANESAAFPINQTIGNMLNFEGGGYIRDNGTYLILGHR